MALLSVCLSFRLFPILFKEVAWGKYFNPLTPVGWEMSLIAGNQMFYTTGKGNLEK